MIRPLAEQIMLFFVEFYRVNRLGKIEVPMPKNSRGEDMTDHQIDIWLGQKWSLFYRPPSSIAPFTTLMDSFSGTSSWTTHDMDIFREATWEPTDNGYWFWADIDWSKGNLVTEEKIDEELSKRLLSIEEYIIVNYSSDCPNPLILNYPFWREKHHTWLRTKVGGRLLVAHSGDRIQTSFDKPAYPRVMKK